MSSNYTENKSNRGGKREGSGHPKTGITKAKISISVTETVWQSALKKWNGKGSELVNKLVLSYVRRGREVLEMGAI